jgi:hypothetical protein
MLNARARSLAKKRKERPLLQDADRRLRRNLLLIAATFAALAVGLIVTRSLRPAFIDSETYKLLLQFFLVTAGGGGVLAIISNARDESSRRQERAASIREMYRDLDAAYRALKKTKRSLRAHRDLPTAASGGTAPVAGAARPIPRAVFEKAMDDLLGAQLALETICDHIGQRNDILYPDRLRRMKEPLRYTARYFHDVHEDFEKGRVRLEADHYDIGDAANLNDFLNSRKAPRSRPAEVDTQLARLKGRTKLSSRVDGLLSPRGDARQSARADILLSARADALKAIIAVSPPDPAEGKAGSSRGKTRYADVAAACFDLLADELADARRKLLS